MRTHTAVPNTNFVKMGAALGAALALALPAAAAQAASTPAPATPPVAPAVGGLTFTDPMAPTVFADGSTLATPVGDLLGDVVEVTGTLAGTHPGDTVLIQRLDPSAGWVAVATATVGPDGSYDASWHTDRAGHTTVRAVPSTQAAVASTAVSATTSTEGRAITVYRKAKVTWYGPGFYGKKTACGRKLTRAMLGVANKTLPCGTLIDLYYNGNTTTVPVIDRGPFRHGTSYDLTAATAQVLGVTATTTVGAVRSVVPTPVAPAASTTTPAAAAATAAR
jgi:rare lipoprotein A